MCYTMRKAWKINGSFHDSVGNIFRITTFFDIRVLVLLLDNKVFLNDFDPTHKNRIEKRHVLPTQSRRDSKFLKN